MSLLTKRALVALCFSQAVAGCSDVKPSDFIHFRENGLPEIGGEWPVGDSGRHFIVANLESRREVYGCKTPWARSTWNRLADELSGPLNRMSFRAFALEA